MRAMGPQAATALRLVVDPSVPVIRRLDDGLPADWEPLGSVRPSVHAQAAVARQRQAAAVEVVELRDRVRELKVEVAHLSRQLEEAREQGRREERAVTARTMGGRIPSILGGTR